MGRQRRLNDPLFLGDFQYRKVQFQGQGGLFDIQPDTSRMEAAFALSYGLGRHLSFDFAFPFYSESRGQFSKAGQGDFLAALTWHGRLKRFPFLHLGLRETVAFPSGFREELEGFESYTADRIHGETLLLLELTGGDPEAPRFLLDLHGGFRTDNHRENTVSIWGAGIRYNLWRNVVQVESEFGQEMTTAAKLPSYQFYAGTRFRLPFGFALRLGAEQRLFDDLDRFGLYAGLSWSHQPRIPVEIRRRHLRESLQRKLELKNRVPGFTLEPGDSGSAGEGSDLPFLPLSIAILPFAEEDVHPIASRLEDSCRDFFERDTSLTVLSPDLVLAALENLRIEPGTIPTPLRAQEIGRALSADYILCGRILRSAPGLRRGLDLSPLLVRSRMISELQAMAYLIEVQNARIDFKGVIESTTDGEHQLLLLHADRGHNEFIDRAPERQRLSQRNLESWTRAAMDELFYEYSVQWVVE